MRSQRYNRRWPPLDMLNLAAILQNHGHFVVLHDARAVGLSPERLSRLTADADRVVVDTSPLDRWQCPNLDLTHLVRLTRSIPAEKLILCGVHGTLFPSRMTELTGARIIMSGEPEVSGPALFNALDRKSPLSGVPGIHWTEGGKIQSGPPAPLADLCAMPLPAYSLVRPEMYEYELLGKKLAVLETARGCPNRCAFCLKTMYGSRVRLKDPLQVASELELVLSLGFETVYFIDLEFTMLRERTLELCEILRKYGLRWCCQTRIDAVDAHLLRQMRKSGCSLIHYGIESGMEKTRELAGKPLSNARIERVILETRQAGIAAAGFFLFGFPWETASDWRETGRFARRLPLSYASFHRVTPYPGTSLGKAFEHEPWWVSGWTGAACGGPDLTREFLKFYLRPAYLLDAFRSGADPAPSFRLFAGFLSGMLSFFTPAGKVPPESTGPAPPSDMRETSMQTAVVQTALKISHDRHGPPALSLVIPVYNEQDTLIPNLRKLLFFFQDRGIDAEIIIGSNGSTDATVEMGRLIESIWPGRIGFFHLSSRGAVGKVFRIAAGLASAPLIISMDMDLSVDLEFIASALDLLRTADVVVGSKKSGAQSRSAVRLLGSKLFILCAGVLLRLPYDDYSIGAKAYRVSSVQPLLPGMSEDTNYVLDLLCRARQAELRIEVLPIACSDWRTSRFRLFREALTRFLHLFRLWMRQIGKSARTRALDSQPDESPAKPYPRPLHER